MKNTTTPLKKISLIAALVTALGATALPAQASLQLQSSVVVIEQKDGEGTIAIQNTADQPVLLFSELVNVPEDDADLLIVTPPITRVESKDTQMVRFILKDSGDLKTERLKRVTFEGIPQTTPNVVQISIRQNIPVIIRPAGLAAHSKPWSFLKWRHAPQGITVENTGPYIVRMSPDVKALPSGDNLSLQKSYILPGQTLTVSRGKSEAVTGVSISPASLNGYIIASEEMPVSPAASK